MEAQEVGVVQAAHGVDLVQEVDEGTGIGRDIRTQRLHSHRDLEKGAGETWSFTVPHSVPHPPPQISVRPL